jgi:peptide subunit release factor RF-3
LEDTFRTLTAVDNQWWLTLPKVWKNKQRNWSQYVDYVKIVFINKMDREGKDALT